MKNPAGAGYGGRFMALVKCKDCGSNVSDAAPACPNCGRPQAHSSKATRNNPNGTGWLALILLIAGVWIYNKATDNDPPSASTEASTQTAASKPADTEPAGFDVEGHYSKNSSVPEDKCKENLACWSDRFLAEAEVDCKTAIDHRAIHETKWNDGFLTPMFTRFGWGGKGQTSHSQIRFIGDAVLFQNGFGAFTPMSYVCELDTSTKSVVSVDIFEGRLDQGS